MTVYVIDAEKESGEKEVLGTYYDLEKACAAAQKLADEHGKTCSFTIVPINSFTGPFLPSRFFHPKETK